VRQDFGVPFGDTGLRPLDINGGQRVLVLHLPGLDQARPFAGHSLSDRRARDKTYEQIARLPAGIGDREGRENAPLSRFVIRGHKPGAETCR
jgi:hypothetical protein